MLHAKPGDVVAQGAPLMTLYTDEPARFARAHEALNGAVAVGVEGSRIERMPLVLGRIDG